MQWKWEFGPSFIAIIVGGLLAIGVDIWNSSATYYGITHRLDTQGEKIDRVATGSRDRFKTVADALDKNAASQQSVADRVTKVESSIGFISGIVQRLESRVDGGK